MDNLTIEAAKYTPAIEFNAESRHLSIRGESYPENTADFYAPIFQWLDQFLKSEGTVQLDMEIVYFNSSTSKVFIDLFDRLEEYAEQGQKVVLNWIFDEENESAVEYGEDFKEDMEHMEFNLVPKES
jgi:hypothetical protein